MPRGLGSSNNIVAQYATLFALIEALANNGSSSSKAVEEQQQHPIQTLDQLIRLIRHNPDLGILDSHDKIVNARVRGYLTSGGFPRLTSTGQKYSAEHGEAVRTEAVEMAVARLKQPNYRNYNAKLEGSVAESPVSNGERAVKPSTLDSLLKSSTSDSLEGVKVFKPSETYPPDYFVVGGLVQVPVYRDSSKRWGKREPDQPPVLEAGTVSKIERDSHNPRCLLMYILLRDGDVERKFLVNTTNST